MAASTMPITLYSHATGPNPWKVAIILEELGLPYETKFMEMADLKKPPFEKLNPNGRVPAIEDPNTGVVLWESGAILEYLCDTYDKEQNISYGDKFPERYQCKQWLFFQVSGQGPYYGQKAWFTFFHSEKAIRSAIDRYANEIKRVIGVIDAHLKETGTGWLVGDKCTYADLSFVPWDMMLGFLMGDNASSLLEAHPYFKKWHGKKPVIPEYSLSTRTANLLWVIEDSMMARSSVMKIVQDKQKASKK